MDTQNQEQDCRKHSDFTLEKAVRTYKENIICRSKALKEARPHSEH